MLFGIIKFFGIALFLYLTWRELYDDYKDDLLISYSWLILLATFVGGRLTYGLINWGVWNDSILSWFQPWQKPGFVLIGGIVSAFLFTLYYCQKNNWKVWSFLEDMTPIYCLFWLFISKEGWLIKAVLLAGFVLAKFMEKRYRSFVWYKSGKKGFIFFFVTLFVAMLMVGVSIVLKDRWYLTVLYLTISLISLVGLFILGEVLTNLTTKRKTNGNNNS